MTNSNLAPIAIMAYKRTRHLSQALDALEACPEFSESLVFIFSDGPKNDEAIPMVAAVRSLLRERQRPNMTIVESSVNRGLAASAIDAITTLCTKFGRVIVLEDDLIASPCTLTWLNAGLNRYVHMESVWQICAHQYEIPQFRNRKEGMLLPMESPWGWATWDRAWVHFDPAATGWEALKTDTALRRRFDLDRAYPNSDLLEKQMSGHVDSRAIRWAWSMFKKNGLALYPPRSLVSNIGMDETATHSSFTRLKRLIIRSPSVAHEISCPTIPDDLVYDPQDERLVLNAMRRMWWPTRLRAWLRGAL